MADSGKELERSRDKAGTYGATLLSAKAKARRLTSNMYGLRERSKGDKADQRSTANRAKAAEMR